MTETELSRLVQTLKEHGCVLLIEEHGGTFSASALKGMWSPVARFSPIAVTAPTVEKALVELAKALDEMNWPSADLDKEIMADCAATFVDGELMAQKLIAEEEVG